MAHSGAGIADLCAWLHELSGGHPERVHAGIEVPHGAVVEMLLEREVQVYAINPKQLDRFRDRFTVAGAKDDRRDARVLADSLRTDRRSFRQLQVQAPPVIELREWSRLTVPTRGRPYPVHQSRVWPRPLSAVQLLNVSEASSDSTSARRVARNLALQSARFLFAEHLTEEVLLNLPHRQFVFALPKALRIFFRHDAGYSACLAVDLPHRPGVLPTGCR